MPQFPSRFARHPSPTYKNTEPQLSIPVIRVFSQLLSALRKPLLYFATRKKNKQRSCRSMDKPVYTRRMPSTFYCCKSLLFMVLLVIIFHELGSPTNPSYALGLDIFTPPLCKIAMSLAKTTANLHCAGAYLTIRHNPQSFRLSAE